MLTIGRQRHGAIHVWEATAAPTHTAGKRSRGGNASQSQVTETAAGASNVLDTSCARNTPRAPDGSKSMRQTTENANYITGYTASVS